MYVPYYPACLEPHLQGQKREKTAVMCYTLIYKGGKKLEKGVEQR